MAIIKGNTDSNNLRGTKASDWMYGYGGNDTLNGRNGIDTLIGGTGDDTYIVDTTTDVIIEKPGEGTDTVISSVTYTLAENYINNLTLTGSSNLNGKGNSYNNVITGNAGNNTLKGNAGKDTLNGGSGIDTLIGGIGDDTYIVDTTTDVIVEVPGEGTDTIISSVTYTLAENYVNNLTLTGISAINGTGNSYNNLINDNEGNNLLFGGDGNDTIYGYSGNDTLYGEKGLDIISPVNEGDSQTSRFRFLFHSTSLNRLTGCVANFFRDRKAFGFFSF